MKISRLWRNWTFHNLVAHPASELVYLLTRSERWSGWVHDATLPPHRQGEGRG